MPLQSELDRFREAWEARVGAEITRMIGGDIEDLRGSGILDRTAKAGQRWPATANLLDHGGRPFDLARSFAARPAIVTFYRGGWCPYCNLELRAYQALLGDIRAQGGDLIAISPELPDHTSDTLAKNDLEYSVLSDVGGTLAAALGIRFTLSDAVRPFYEKAGHALPQRNGDGVWALPMPATFVVARGGIIAAAFVEPDYRKRIDPRDALRALASARAMQTA